MKILEVIRTVDPAYGGPVEVVRQLSGVMQAELGATVEAATLDDPEADFVANFPIKVHALGPGKGTYGHSPLFVPWMEKHAAEFDAIVVNGIWQYQSLGTYKALLKSGKPYFVFPHGMLDPYFNETYPLKKIKKQIYWKLFEQKVLANAAAVMYTCEEERVLAQKSFSGYKATERVVSLGIATPEFDLEACKKEFLFQYPHLQGERFLLFLSRIDPKKGIDMLIQAFASIKDSGLKLVIAGPDKSGLRPSLEELARASGVSDLITWTGMITGSMKWGAYAACEAFALTTHQENFGIVLAEAMACSRPVLTTNKTNIWREINDSNAGLICTDTVDSVQGMLKEWIALSPEARSAFGERAYSCFKEKFEVGQSARLIYKTYEDILK